MPSLREHLTQHFAPTVAVEVELLITLCVETALEMAVNGADYGAAEWHFDGGARHAIEPDQILAQITEDFSNTVQVKEWPTQDQTHGNPVTGEKTVWPTPEDDKFRGWIEDDIHNGD